MFITVFKFAHKSTSCVIVSLIQVNDQLLVSIHQSYSIQLSCIMQYTTTYINLLLSCPVTLLHMCSHIYWFINLLSSSHWLFYDCPYIIMIMLTVNITPSFQLTITHSLQAELSMIVFKVSFSPINYSLGCLSILFKWHFQW